ncbi:MAG: hypothetical protein WBA22_09495, partial [Candidatus Methanofastidiosia archaeon]
SFSVSDSLSFMNHFNLPIYKAFPSKICKNLYLSTENRRAEEHSGTASVINNKYYTLIPGTSYIYQSETEEGVEKNIVIVTNRTRVILGGNRHMAHAKNMGYDTIADWSQGTRDYMQKAKGDWTELSYEELIEFLKSIRVL